MALIARTLDKKIRFYLTRDCARLEKGMRNGSYDFVLAGPSDYPARGVRDYGYRLVVTTQPEGHVVFIVGKNSPLKTIADVRGKQLALPEQAA